MNKRHPLYYVLVTLLAATFLITFNIGIIWSTSVDLAQHYALVFRLFDSLQLVPNDPSLGEMNIYPPASHMAAALVGRMVGSPFLGMHLVALSSLVMLWAAHIAILYAAPNRTGPLTALALALVVVVNHGSLRLHGAEISNAYHYAQLVGLALAYVAIAVALRIDTRMHRLWVHLFLLVAMVIVAAFHLMPALLLLGVLGVLMLLDVVAAQRGQRMRTAVVGAVVMALGVSLIVMHPSFAAMRIIAAHNGGMSLGILGPMWSLVLACFIALASLMPLLRAWRRDPAAHVMYKYMIAYGVAIASLCLLQMALQYVGFGSEYAVKKYAYALGTFLILRLAMWIGAAAAARAARRPDFARLSAGAAFRVGVYGVALIATVLGCTRMRHELDTFAVVNLERQLLTLRETGLPAAPPGKYNVVEKLDGMPLMIDYMFSLAVTGTSRDIIKFVKLPDLGPLSNYAFIVSSKGKSDDANSGDCVKQTSETLVVRDAACVANMPMQTATSVANPP